MNVHCNSSLEEANFCAELWLNFCGFVKAFTSLFLFSAFLILNDLCIGKYIYNAVIK